MRKNSFHRLLVLAALLSPGALQNSLAQEVIPIGETVDEKVTNAREAIATDLDWHVRNWLFEAEKRAKALIEKGTNEQKLFLVQAGNEAQTLIAIARAEFGTELGKTIRQASEAIMPVLSRIDSLNKTVADLGDRAVEIEDSIALDVSAFPLTDAYTGVRRLRGNTFVQDETTQAFTIEIVGRFGGTESTQGKVLVQAYLDGTDLGEATPTPPYTYSFTVPSDLVANKFADKVVTLPLKIRITRNEPDSILSFFGLGASPEIVEQEFPVALLPDLAGELELVTHITEFEWKSSAPLEVTEEIKDEKPITVAVKTPVTTLPFEGSERLVGTVDVSCGKVLRPAYKFGNGKVLFASDPLFEVGWRSPNHITGKDTDWDDAESAFKRAFGEGSFGFWSKNRCHRGRCLVYPKELIERAELIPAVPIDDCASMKPGAINWDANKKSVTVWIRGKSNIESAWKVVAPTEVFRTKGFGESKTQRFPVYASKDITIDIDERVSKMYTLKFHPLHGRGATVSLGDNVPRGPTLVKLVNEPNSPVKRYIYSFSYHTSN